MSSAPPDTLLALSSWTEIKADFSAYWLVYLSMPFVAAFVGWSTKIVALEMLYRPIEFRGWGGPFGWQGIVPRRAGKVGSKTIDLLTANLLKPEELLDRIDPTKRSTRCAVPPSPKRSTTSHVTSPRRFAPACGTRYRNPLDAGSRSACTSRRPQIVENMLTEMKADLPRYLDLHFMAVTALVRNKEKLVKLMRSVTTDAMAFVRRSGIYFGLVIGLVQMVAWALFKNPWIMPAFGFAVGFISDYIALNMLFRPMRPRKFLGFIPLSGPAARRAGQDHP